MTTRASLANPRVVVGGTLLLLGIVAWAAGLYIGIKMHRRGKDYYRVRATLIHPPEKLINNASGVEVYYVEYADSTGAKYTFSDALSKYAFKDGDPLLGYPLFVAGYDSRDAWPVSDGPPTQVPAAVAIGVGALMLCVGLALVSAPLAEIRRQRAERSNLSSAPPL